MMDWRINIEKYQEGIYRIFKLILSRENFNHFCAGCPEIDNLFGRCEDVGFCIYNGDKMPSEFRHHSNDFYFAYVGIPGNALPLDFTSEQLDAETEKHFGNLENAINSSGRLPMTIAGTDSKKPLVVGYVEMCVESQ